ncbi:MAG: alcohol dehydrogenase catalytic domain-containing protein [Anaerolineae bacterium]|nr:alcohol dehydrogenase catalytic domain-containing protein [Anaerolineae bacterium]
MDQVTEQDRAVVFDGTLTVQRRPRPVPAADEALIRLRLAGICNTDLELVAGYKGFSGVLGHEFVGDVIAGPAVWIGQRVVGAINVGCGDCDMCRQGVAEHCRRRAVLGILNYDGAFADVFRLAARNLVRVPEALPDEVAVFAEPVAAACQIVEMAHVRPTDRVVVVGAGKLGLLSAQVLKLTGADVTVIVRREQQARLLAGWGMRAVARDDVPNGQADVVVDCTGNAAGFAEALDLVRPRGTVALKSTYAGLPQADLTRVVVDELRIVGSRCGPFDAALRLLASGAVRVEELITARYTLDDAVGAFDHAAQPGVLKVLLEP